MSRIGRNDAEPRPVHMPPKTPAELEAEALAWCESMGNKLNAKKSGYKPKRSGGRHADRG